MSRMDQEPDFGEPPYEPTREEQEGDAWEYWHQRAHKAEADAYRLRQALRPLATADWYSRGNGKYQADVEGSVLDEAKAALTSTHSTD